MTSDAAMKEEETSWNPHYASYAKAHGRTPQEQLAHDREQHPGGCMVGFILWMSRLKREFVVAHPNACFHSWDGRPTEAIVDYPRWERFVEERAIAEAKRRQDGIGA